MRNFLVWQKSISSRNAFQLIADLFLILEERRGVLTNVLKASVTNHIHIRNMRDFSYEYDQYTRTGEKYKSKYSLLLLK